METFTVGAREQPENLEARLQPAVRQLAHRGVETTTDTEVRGDMGFITCVFEAAEEDKGALRDICVHQLAQVLSSHIIERLERHLVADLVRRHYHYFDDTERRVLIRHTLHLLGHRGEAPGEDDVLLSTSAPAEDDRLPLGYGEDGRVYRRSQIIEDLVRYLHEHNHVLLEGFVQFRLQDYRSQLQAAVDRAVEDFLADQEYDEFVHLLRFFVDIQEPAVSEADVVFSADSFDILDDDGGSVKAEYVEEAILDNLEGEVETEDLLVSALITMAPEAIVLHPWRGVPEPGSMETLQQVFDARLRFCDGCPRCHQEESGPES